MLLALLVTGYIALQNSRVQTVLTQFLANKISKQLNTEISIGKVNIAFFKKIVLNDVMIEAQNGDTLFYTELITANIDTLKYRKRKISLSLLSFGNSTINIERDSANRFNFSFIFDSIQPKKDTTVNWKIRCNKFEFQHSNLEYHDLYALNKNSFFINQLNFDIYSFFQSADSTKFKLNNLTLNDGKKLNLNRLSADFLSTKDKIEIREFNLETNRSVINNTEVDLIFSDNGFTTLSETEIDIRFSGPKISFSEIAELIPTLKGMDQVIDISGHIYGKLDDLKGKNLLLNSGKNTTAFFDFYANDLTDPENLYLFVDLKNLKTSFTEISKINLPHSSAKKNLIFPESFYNTGLFTYRGNFSGFLSDFVAYGTFSSKMGALTTDVSVVPDKNDAIKYRGKVRTKNFQLDQLLGNENLGKLTFNGNVDGKFFRNSGEINGKFKGEIAEIELYDYAYNNISFDGALNKKMFDGQVTINDPNLEFDFAGHVNFNPEVPEFDFKLELQKALLGNLGMSEIYPNSELAFTMLANFTGDKLDNLNGSIVLEEGTYKNRNGQLDLKGMELKSVPGSELNLLTFNSDYFDVEIAGDYHFQTIVNAFEKSANYYLPASNYEKLAQAKKNTFEYQINAKSLNELTAVFAPLILIETPFVLYGNMDSENSVFEMEGSIPGFSTENVSVKDIFIGNKPIGNLYSSIFRFGEIVFNNDLAFYNLTVDSKISTNVIDNQITWTNYHKLTYSGNIKTRSVFSKNINTNNPHIEIEGFPSRIFIADTLWQIAPFTATIDSTAIEINNFRFFNQNQQFLVDGKISDEKSDIMNLNIGNINLKNLETYLDKKLHLNGTLNGSAGISDFYGKILLFSDLTIQDLKFRDQKIGDVSLKSQWDNTESFLNSELTIKKDNQQNLYVRGTLNPETNEINYDSELNNLSLVLLETVTGHIFSNVKGDVSGKVKVHGKPDHVLFNGSIKSANAGLTINYTQVNYNFNDSVYFKGDTIQFKNMNVQDAYKNKGILNGTLIHQNFQNMVYNLTFNSPKILAMNTTPKDNEQFFGQVYANGRMRITGIGTKVNMTGSATTLPGTSVNISLDYESEIKKYDFIQFVSTQESEKKEFLFQKKNEDDFTMNLTITATPEARAQLIYNSQIGDIIKAQGEGILLFGMDKEGNITLSGNYTVEKGDYLFTLHNVINKRFSIEQGGSINWSGDPYNAIIDINAVYSLKASLYDLLVNSYENNYQNQRIPVECKILITENLSNPDIKFEIDFPSSEDRIKDELQQFFNTEEEMNKQILSLVVLGKFYTPEYLRGLYEAQSTNLIGTTASELFSNQLSNWLSQINSNFDIGLNYRPGKQITNDEIELAMSTQMFNDRVIINGNIGNNVNPYSSSNSQLVGDFDVNVKLNPSGKIQFKAYNRSNNNLIYETSPYTQGIGLSFKEEYNSINDLLQKMKAIFRRKKSQAE